VGLNGVPAYLETIDILEAIEQTHGVIKHAAEKLGVCPQTIYAHMYRNQEVKDKVEECRAEYQYWRGHKQHDDEIELVDEAYKAILALVKGKNINAVMFVLKEKGGWDKALKIQAQKQDQTLVFQVNAAGQIEGINDKPSSNTIAIPSKDISAKDIECVKKRD